MVRIGDEQIVVRDDVAAEPRFLGRLSWDEGVMPRSLWTGTISFGLVSVPVRMFTATHSEELRFHFLDRRDMSRIRYDKVNQATGEQVDDAQIIRGFEVEKGRFVELTDEDVEALDVGWTHSIDICEFVSIDEIDPLFFRKGYYLLPQEGAEKPYRLLATSLAESGRVAIAKLVLRDKQHLACLRPHDDVLLIETMYYADEILLPDEVPNSQLRESERKMATRLIDNLTTKWEPTKYHDRYRNKLLDLLRNKAEGGPLPERAEEKTGEVVDLMDALRRSVQATKAKGAKSAKPPKRPATRKKPARKHSEETR